ncbi:hypothetical protein TREES_T100008783 [Tupaia chinensis]|uniref:Uncharacterized protein n=1 Tax=Tupaia chinensis TaxID=246437 RepID=L9L0S0_TUPCH|nr:hypothetical protein TREES_T100008783 [Tupaia chinensis]
MGCQHQSAGQKKRPPGLGPKTQSAIGIYRHHLAQALRKQRSSSQPRPEENPSALLEPSAVAGQSGGLKIPVPKYPQCQLPTQPAGCAAHFTDAVVAMPEVQTVSPAPEKQTNSLGMGRFLSFQARSPALSTLAADGNAGRFLNKVSTYSGGKLST